MLALTADHQADEAVPQPGGRRVQAALPPLLRPEAAAADGAKKIDVEVRKMLTGVPRARRYGPFSAPAPPPRSRRRIRIGIPKMLNIDDGPALPAPT